MNNTAPNTVTIQENALKYDIGEALKYLKEDLITRDCGEEFKQLINNKNTNEAMLKAKFGDTNISNWKRGKPISRAKAIELCFALNINIYESEVFLQKICGHDWFHLRNYEDVIYYFCLLNGIAYEKAVMLITKYENLKAINPAHQEDVSLTNYIKHDIIDLNSSEEDLCRYLDENRDKFGSFNNTAYNYFKSFFDEAQRRESVALKMLEEKEKHEKKETSFGKVCEILRAGIPDNLKGKNLTPLQKSIYEDAPSRPALNLIYNKSIDKNGKVNQVTRKSLIMAWMLINESKEFISRVMIINQILYNCGMPKLDSKNPFDWIVLNALESDGLPRIEELNAEIFRDEIEEGG